MDLIGIIGAMEEEVLALKEKMNVEEVRSVASLEFYKGRLNNRDVVVVQSGIGKVNAAICTQILIDVYRVAGIINTGVGGALHRDLNIGDVVISTDTLQHDMDATGFGYDQGEIPRMETSTFKADTHMIHLAETACDHLKSSVKVYKERIVSGDLFVSDPGMKSKLFDQFSAYCTEMEGAAVAQTCYLNHLPFVVIRSISDQADASAEVNFDAFAKEAALNSIRIIEGMLEHL